MNWWLFELNVSGMLVGLGALGALIYEMFAIISERIPTISSIVRAQIQTHYILSSGISAVFVGFTFFLFLDWFKPK